MSKQSRRTFMKNTVLAGAATAFTISGTKASGRSIGANDRIRVCIAGINSRGKTHMREFGSMNNVEVSYLVDPDSRLFGPRSETIKENYGNTPKCYQDLRKALDKEEIDVVTIASTNQWHSLLGIWACQAGKDVYIEKPCSHNVYEGRKLVEAAEKYGCIVQHGTQRRGSSGYYKQIAAIQSGEYGKLLISYGRASKPRRSIGFKDPTVPPKELDFDLWLGPAPKQPYHENIVHYNWHWFWNFGNGEIGNQGVHQMDVAFWGVNAATGLIAPKRVISMGGRFGYKDQAQTPNTQLTLFDFGETKLFFEDYGLVTNDTRRVDNEFHMEKGIIRGGKFYPNGSDKGENLIDAEYVQYPGGVFGNFINCVRSRKREELNADVLVAHQSSALCHLGNASYRLGKQVPFNKKAQSLGDDKDAVTAFNDMKEHLKDHTDMKLEESTYALGPWLEYDGQKERFTNNEEANEIITRNYRAPYVVPKKV